LDAIDALSGIPLFKKVPRTALHELTILAPVVEFAEGHIVFHQGWAASVSLLVLRGKLVARVAHEGTERDVGEIGAGEIIGEQALFVPRGHRSASVIAKSPCTCLLLEPGKWEQYSDNPAMVALERHLLETLARRIRRTNAVIREAWSVERDHNASGTDEGRRSVLRRWFPNLFGEERT